jgi:hypothetical protein
MPEEKEKLTRKQQNALHLYLEMIANALNDKGHSVQEVLSKAKLDIFWTKENVKENLWREIQEAMYGTRSTTELNKQEQIDRIHDVINKFLSENFPDVGYIEFPHVCKWCGGVGDHDKYCKNK